VAVNVHCALDCALDLWFLVPDELEQFRNGGMSNGEVRVSNHETLTTRIEDEKEDEKEDEQAKGRQGKR